MSDDRLGSRAITESLLRAGHESILVLTERRPDDDWYYHDRILGFTDALTAHGITFDPAALITVPVDYGDYINSALAAVNEQVIPIVSGRHHSPTAIFALSDYLAFSVTKALSDAGIRLPEDISLASFGGWRITKFMPTSIESWVQPVPDILRTTGRAVSCLLERKPFTSPVSLEPTRPNDGTPKRNAQAISPTCYMVPGYMRPGQSVRRINGPSCVNLHRPGRSVGSPITSQSVSLPKYR